MHLTNGLSQLQKEAVQSLYDELIRLAFTTDRLELSEGTSILRFADDGKQSVLFHQLEADLDVREKFRLYRGELPSSCRVHQLPLEKVGALASLGLDAFVGFSESPAHDFIGVSWGIEKLRYWGIVAANAQGAELFTRPSNQGPHGINLTQGWWQSSLLAMSADIYGHTDRERLALIANFAAEDLGEWDATLSFLLRGFIFYHEMAHYELKHADIHRARWLAGQQASARDCHLMEWEADQFAWDQIRRWTSEETGLRVVSVLFALFAMRPDLLRHYPQCPDGRSHPHPLSRFFWLVQKIGGDNPQKHTRYVWFAISFLCYVLEDLGAQFPVILSSEIFGTLVHKSGAPS